MEVSMGKRLVVWIAVLSVIPLIFSGLNGYKSAPTSSHAQPQSLATSRSPSQTTTIEFGGLLGFHYSPNIIHLSPGDSVKWQGDFTMHPLVSDEGLWPTVNTGTEFTFTFNQPGVYHFHCFFHGPIGMKGTLTVGFFDYIPLVHR
jgi:plastocyanin